VVISATDRGGIRQKCALHCSHYQADVAAETESARGFTAAVRQRAALMHALFVWLPVINFRCDAKSWRSFQAHLTLSYANAQGAARQSSHLVERALKTWITVNVLWISLARACVSECVRVICEAVRGRKTAAGGDRCVSWGRCYVAYLNCSIFACVTLQWNLLFYSPLSALVAMDYPLLHICLGNYLTNVRSLLCFKKKKIK